MPVSKRRSSKRKTQQVVASALVALIAGLVLVIYGAVTGSGWLPIPGETPASTENGSSAGTAEWYNLYFTDPAGPEAASLRGGPDEALAAAIDQARLSVDMAIYDFDLWGLQNALQSAYRRGVTVRVVAESDNRDEAEVQALMEEGIPVLGDRREGLMHDKFVIIDRLETWTGSMNFTVNDAYRNDNNLIRIRSSRLAQNYLAEFEEMFVEDKFGPRSPANTPFPNLNVESVLVEVYFSPDDGVAERLVRLVQSARESIYFMVYSFTADDIATAMIDRFRAGVTVSGVFEKTQYASNVGTEFDHLQLSGIDVRLDGNPRNMHNKVLIIDRQTVVTGSYNFSASAEENNDENILVIHSPEISSQYLAEFQRVYAEALP